MKISVEFLRNRKPITADPDWNSQLTREDFISMFPDRAAQLGMIPVRSSVVEIPAQPDSNSTEEMGSAS